MVSWYLVTPEGRPIRTAEDDGISPRAKTKSSRVKWPLKAYWTSRTTMNVDFLEHLLELTGGKRYLGPIKGIWASATKSLGKEQFQMHYDVRIVGPNKSRSTKRCPASGKIQDVSAESAENKHLTSMRPLLSHRMIAGEPGSSPWHPALDITVLRTSWYTCSGHHGRQGRELDSLCKQNSV